MVSKGAIYIVMDPQFYNSSFVMSPLTTAAGFCTSLSPLQRASCERVAAAANQKIATVGGKTGLSGRRRLAGIGGQATPSSFFQFPLWRHSLRNH